MAGLDPAIHEETPRIGPYGFDFRLLIMDRRVKPGDDGGVWCSARDDAERAGVRCKCALTSDTPDKSAHF
jgi:hypothetical protein